MNHLSTPQTAHSEPVRQEHTRLSGFDWLRLFAIILVTYQHACTLLRLDSWTKLYRIDVGQFGVCIFLALSAILATQDKRTPWQWLWRRFVKIMPAYWIVMLVSFLLAWLSGHKSFDIWQFISQMLGTGFFTHPHNLVNSPTWFVSLLLALYLYTFLFRFILPNSLQATVLAITYISYASLYYKQLIVYDHISTYIICVVICLLFQQRNMQFALLLSGASLMLLSWCGVRPLNHCACSLLLVGLFWHFPAISNIVRMLIEYSYEILFGTWNIPEIDDSILSTPSVSCGLSGRLIKCSQCCSFKSISGSHAEAGSFHKLGR
jgi:peptidoglycan/LPS O-acetylase OafA/YrhL